MYAKVSRLFRGDIKYIANSLWLIGEKVLVLAASLLTNLILARHLGAELFGIYSYALALATIITPFCALGLNAIVSKYILEAPEEQGKILGTAVLIRCVAAIVVFVLTTTILWPYLLQWEEYSRELQLVFMAGCFSSLLVFDYFLQARLKSKLAAVWRSATLYSFSLLKLVAVYLDVGLDVLLYILAVELLVGYLGFPLLYRVAGGRVGELCYSPVWARTLLGRGKWLMLSGIAAIVNLKIDQLMLASMTTAEELGIYSVAARMSEAFYFIPIALVASYFPKLLEKRIACAAMYENELQKLTSLLALLALVFAFATTVFSTPLIRLLFGEEYLASGQILAIHVWAGVFVFQRELLSKWLIAEDLVKISLMTQCVGALTNVGLNVLLIPLYGAMGAAIATLASYGVSGYLSLWFFRETRPFARIMTRASLNLMRPKFIFSSLKC